MPETKNNFIKAKMNQDLDDRLIPQGEYRIGQNVTISRSEGDGVGTFQNILGNNSLSDFGLTGTKLEIIGYLVEEINNMLYVFITNYNDSSLDQISNKAPSDSSHYILQYNFTTNSSIILVQGNFLNFSKTHRIYGVNLIENLLFFTDDRNQPRKINVDIAVTNSSYYNSEDKVSVAKFYPSNSPQFYKEIKLKATNSQTAPGGTALVLDVKSTAAAEGLFVGMPVSLTPQGGTLGENIYLTNVSSVNGSVTLSANCTWTANDVITFSQYGLKNCGNKYLPPILECNLSVVSPSSGTYTLQNANSAAPILDGWNAVYNDSKLYVANSGSSAPIITEDAEYKIVNYAGSVITIKDSNNAVPANLDGTTVKIYRENPDYQSDFSGDAEFLKDKFVRFSYRYKFDDNEYSLIAPFTQIAFTPKQFGSFVLNDEELAAKSSVVNFFENNIDCIDLFIRTPFEANSATPPAYPTWTTAFNDLNIKEVEILCKFANETSIKVIDVLDQTFVNNLSNSGNDSYIKYTYKSTKPIRVLPEKDVTRVYDKVPIRALAQEVSGNRVMYGNYIDKHTSPLSLEYKLAVTKKVDIPLSQDKRVFNNHTLKENRNYQVGIVLSDRYGRQSDVILSSIQGSTEVSGDSYGASTIYNPYSNAASFAAADILNFTGKQMLLYLETAIPETISQPGYPGLYSASNPLGWYTYKIVVKQQQQEYYNVYIPSSYREDTANYDYLNSYFSLVNDNINKVPKDLENVGPEEKEFRSSVNLFPRVNPTTQAFSNTNSYFIEPLRQNDDISSIIYNSQQSFDASGVLISTGLEVDVTKLYKGKTATIANIVNNKLFGTTDANSNVASFNNVGVYETDPFVSNLDIFYETSTSGFISELNISINDDNLGPVSLTADTLDIFENSRLYEKGTGTDEEPQYGHVIYTIELRDKDNIAILSTSNTCTLDTVFSSLNPSTNIASKFKITKQVSGNPAVATGRFNVWALDYFYFGNGQNFTFNITATANSITNSTLSFTGALSNVQPQYNEDTNSTSTAPPTTLPYAIPTIAENYRNYSRQTNETPPLSLRPTYYSGAFAGNNTATQGLGTRGSLPYFYNTGSYSNISSKTIGPNNFMELDDRVIGPLPGGATTFTFGKFDNSAVNNSSSSTDNFSILWSGYAGTGGPISFARSFLFGGQSISSVPSNYPTAFQSNVNTVMNYSFDGPSRWRSRIEYVPDPSVGVQESWSVMEEGRDVSRFININGFIGAINGTLNESQIQSDLVYSFTSGSYLKLPTAYGAVAGTPGDGIVSSPFTINGYFGDESIDGSYADIDSALRDCISLTSTGKLSINDDLLWSYFSIGGSKGNLIPNSYNNQLPDGTSYNYGLLMNDRVGNNDTNMYGLFWVELPITITDQGNLTTDIIHTIIISF